MNQWLNSTYKKDRNNTKLTTIINKYIYNKLQNYTHYLQRKRSITSSTFSSHHKARYKNVQHLKNTLFT